MKIRKLKIENFRGIRFFEKEMAGSLNLVVGINGAGKTTIVDALAILFSWFNARIRNRKGNGMKLQNSDITQGEKVCRLTVELDNGVWWSVVKTRSSVRSGNIENSFLAELSSMADGIIEDYEKNNQQIDLPFCMIYGVNRLVAEVPMRLARHDILSPIHIYDSGISSSPINFRRMFEWLRDRSDIENEHKLIDNSYRDNQLEAVRRALRLTLPDYGELIVRRNPRGLVMQKGNRTFDFQQLSDGEKCYISLVADIAKSLALASPCAEDALATSNIIVIDEIELHMHVTWQSIVLDKLRSAFPNCQFVITSHSPYVLINAKTDEDDSIVLIKDGQAEQFEGNSFGMTVKQALSEFFGIEGTLHNNEIKAHLDRMWSMLREESLDADSIRNEYEWLRNHLDPNDQEMTNIAIHLRRNHIEL